MSVLNEIQNWFLNQCNDEWEHGFGIKIYTIDNPGWRIKISLEETRLKSESFSRLEIERSENDWIFCWVENKIFNAACGPLNLEEALGIFLKWANEKGTG